MSRTGLGRLLASRVSVATTAAIGVATAVVLAPSTAGAETTTLSPTGHVKFSLRGNGHGHGMSQYGAEGAAKQGLTFQKIVKFYYPGTTLTTLPASSIRVKLSKTGTALTVLAETGLRAGTVGALTVTGVARYRLIADAGTTLTLQRLLTGATAWTNVATKLPSGTVFTRGLGQSVRVYRTDGTSTRYFDYLRAVRSGTSVMTVNSVSLDSYTRGVTPREMPASWLANAVASQAVAARTYGRYAVEHATNADYDICDTSMCQVYGGAVHYDASGAVVYRDDPAAIVGNNNEVLQYGGKTIFSQFSASNGGWTVYGGQPYLPAQADPYDAAGGTDPYTLQTLTLPVATLAKAFGLKTLTSVVVTKRDGNGTGGGRVLTGYVTGTDSTNAAKQVSFTGFDLQDAIGVGTTWITLQSVA